MKIFHLLALLALGSSLCSAETTIGKKSELKRASSSSVKTPATVVAATSIVKATKVAPEADSKKEQESEYVHIKAEEVNGSEASEKSEQLSLVEPQSQPAEAQQSQKASAADEQLQAHLSSGGSDTISELESSYQAYAEPAPVSSLPSTGPAPRIAITGNGGGYPPQRPAQMQQQQQQAYSATGKPLYRPAPQMSRRPLGHRAPPSYTTMKGKLTGINSVVSQYPHPAPGYPHQVPRHLPRGAAAGYAAFRDFVRAHASKYKQQAQQQQPLMQPQYGSPVTKPAGNSYGPRPQLQQPTALAKTTKVSVAQAYIPHASSSQPSYGAQDGYQSPSPMLAKLYGQHLPRGQGRPEYSKDYGMVIHYPQATVYTEPMTVDQLHKLTGTGISQVLDQLQQQLAHGHRDESNTIRANSAHQLGHGLTIQAKEYLAPGKYGHYVPTTAAVITHQPDQSSGYSQDSGAGSLGSGYERVRQAAAASQANYKQPMGGYSAPTEQNDQPLSAITSLIGSELESLYKANAALTKHLDPVDLHSQIQSYAGSKASKSPLSYQELRGPMALYGAEQPQHQHQRYRQQGSRGPARPARGHRRPQPTRYHQQQVQRPTAYGGPQQQQQHHHHYQRRPQQANGRPQQPAYQRPQQGYQQQAYQQVQQAHAASEQALQQQMQQLMQDFQAGDEQYNGRQQPARPVNQGYPHKVMQKYQQQQQQQQQYGQHEGLDIPQGPNDQIGEIADLIEALKSSLEQHKPEHQEQANDYAGNQQPAAKQHLAEDVRYLAGALGQTPSYAMQVPVSHEAPTQSYQQPASSQPAYQAGQPQQSYQSSQQQQPMYGSSSGAYQQQQQQQPEYNQEQQQQPQAYQQATYQPTSQPLGNSVVAGTYPATAPVPVATAPPSPVAQAEPSQYTSNEQSQIINHLVPVADQQHQHQQQPASQIALGAPTDSHYQQAQSLSSFVDSLPSDYQELLRQPQLDHPHLAIQAAGQQQDTQAGAYSSLTTNVTHLVAPASSSSSSSLPVSAPSSSASSNSSLAQSYQQAAQQAAQAQPTERYTQQQ